MASLESPIRIEAILGLARTPRAQLPLLAVVVSGDEQAAVMPRGAAARLFHDVPSLAADIRTHRVPKGCVCLVLVDDTTGVTVEPLFIDPIHIRAAVAAKKKAG